MASTDRSTCVHAVLLLLLTLQRCCAEIPGFSLNGVSYPDHGLVTLGDIGITDPTDSDLDNALYCLSDLANCCSDGSSTSFQGRFYFPLSNDPVPQQAGNSGFYLERGTNNIRLNRQMNATVTGIFRCQIPTANNAMTNLYIGVYNTDDGNPIIQSLVRSDDTPLTLTCTSDNGPVTSATWRRNCVVLPNNIDYQQFRIINMTESTATFTSTLTIGSGVDDQNGIYSVSIANVRGYSTSSIGVGADYDPIPVAADVSTDGADTILVAGTSQTLACRHSAASGVATSPVSYQWFGPDGSTIGTNSTVTLSPLSEGDTGEYGCQVTVGSGSQERVGCGLNSITVTAPSITALVRFANESATVGSPYQLSCSLIPSPPLTAMELLSPLGTTLTFTWFKGNATIASVVSYDLANITTDENNITTDYFNISSVQVDNAGDYTCQITIEAPYLDVRGSITNQDTGTLRVTIPPPRVELTIPGGEEPQYYKGQSLTWNCDVTILEDIQQGLVVDIEWSKDDSILTNGINTHITVLDVMEISTGNTYRRTVVFNPLNGGDSGSYTCTATVRPSTAGSELVTEGVGTENGTLNVTVPTLSVVVSDVTTRMLDVPPYNTFPLTCTAATFINGTPTPVPVTKSFQWLRTIDSGPPENFANTSMITVAADTAGNHVYTCQVFLGPILSNDSSNAVEDSVSVVVQGPVVPAAPIGVFASNIGRTSVTIGWRIQSILYDPETYEVQYGTDRNDRSLTSSSVSSGSDITRSNFQLSLELTNLTAFTLYFYKVVSTNTAGSSTTQITYNFKTLSQNPDPPTNLMATQTSSITFRFTWDPPEFTYGDLTAYQLSCDPQVIGIPLPETVEISPPENQFSYSNSNGLENAISYNCSMIAVNSEGPSVPSEQVIITPLEAPPTGMPQDFTVDATTSRTVTLSWSPPPLVDQNGVITSYTVSCFYEMNSVVQLASEVTLSDPVMTTYTIEGLRPGMSYRCWVVASNSAGGGPGAGPLTPTTEDDSRLFQVRLTGFTDCAVYVGSNSMQTARDIGSAIGINIDERCQCAFSRDRLTSEVLACFPESPRAVTFRATLHGTENATSSTLIATVEEWVALGLTLNVQSVLLSIDSSCSVPIVSYSQGECERQSVETISPSTTVPTISEAGGIDYIGAVVGGTITVALILVVAISTVVIVVAFLHLRHRKTIVTLQKNNTYSNRELPPITYNHSQPPVDYVTMNACYVPIDQDSEHYDTIDDGHLVYAEVRGEASNYITPVALKTAESVTHNTTGSGQKEDIEKENEDHYYL